MDGDSRPAFVTRDLTKSYGEGRSAVHALRGVSVEIPEGEIVVMLGASGSGKSTLLNILGGLDRPTSGEARFRDIDLGSLPDEGLTRFRRDHIGFVFQFYNLMPSLTARENVELVTEIADNPMSPEEALGLVGLTERVDHFPSQLSGGEQQRVAIARALALDPALIFADEPTGNLDPGTGMEVFALLKELQRERSFALVLATHSERLARGCDRVLRLEGGRLQSLGERETREYFRGLGAKPAPDPML